MKYLTFVIFLCFFSTAFSQEYGQIANHDLKKVLKLALEHPQLKPYYHIETYPKRLPLKIKEFGAINKTNFENFEILGKPVLIIDRKDIFAMNVQDYINIADFSPVNNTLRLQLEYVIESVTANFIIHKIDDNWVVISINLAER
jgi:hypothetical protein